MSPREMPYVISQKTPTTETFYHNSHAGASRFSSRQLTLFSKLMPAGNLLPQAKAPVATIFGSPLNLQKKANELLTFVFLHV